VRKTILLSVLATFVLGCVFAAAQGGADNAGDKGLPFKFPVVVVSSKSDSETAAFLQDPTIQKIGDRSFLVGMSVYGGDAADWQKGHKTWVALDDIAMIVEYESADALKATVDKFKVAAAEQPEDQKPKLSPDE
jgi:hypothetical protein